MSIHWRIAPRITSTVKRKTIILLSIAAASAFIAALAISWEFLTPKVNKSANPISRPGPLIINLDDNQVRELAIQTIRVQRGPIDEKLELVGEIEENAYQSTPINSLVPGRVESVNVRIGDSVKKGHVLARIRSDEVARLAADFLEEMINLDSEIERTRVELNVTESAFRRKEALFKEGIAARATLEIAYGDYKKAKAKLHSLIKKRSSTMGTSRQRLKLYGISEADFERLIKTRKLDNMFAVYAPVNGTIIARDIDIGQMVDPSHQLFVVSDLSQVWATARAYEKDIERLAVGEEIILKVESFPLRRFHGVVDYLGTTIDPDLRTMEVRATVDNQDRALKPKMFARITVVVGHSEGLVVPARVVSRVGEKQVAYVARGDNSFEERIVQAEPLDKGRMVVIEGLGERDAVVVNGNLALLGLAVKDVSRE